MPPPPVLLPVVVEDVVGDVPVVGDDDVVVVGVDPPEPPEPVSSPQATANVNVPNETTPRRKEKRCMGKPYSHAPRE
jgi:hypothetical protein